MATTSEPSTQESTRELVPFRVRHKFAIAGLHCATLELVRDQPDER
jgi:hypothetical protein